MARDRFRGGADEIFEELPADELFEGLEPEPEPAPDPNRPARTVGVTADDARMVSVPGRGGDFHVAERGGELTPEERRGRRPVGRAITLGETSITVDPEMGASRYDYDPTGEGSVTLYEGGDPADEAAVARTRAEDESFELPGWIREAAVGAIPTAGPILRTLGQQLGVLTGEDPLQAPIQASPTAAVRGATDAMTFGHADELAGAIRGGQHRERVAARAEQDVAPESYMAGSVLGAAPMMLVPGASQAAAARGAGQTAQGALALGEGMAAGGLAGSGFSEGDIGTEEHARDVALGALMGGGASALGQGATRMAGSAAQRAPAMQDRADQLRVRQATGIFGPGTSSAQAQIQNMAPEIPGGLAGVAGAAQDLRRRGIFGRFGLASSDEIRDNLQALGERGRADVGDIFGQVEGVEGRRRRIHELGRNLGLDPGIDETRISRLEESIPREDVEENLSRVRMLEALAPEDADPSVLRAVRDAIRSIEGHLGERGVGMAPTAPPSPTPVGRSTGGTQPIRRPRRGRATAARPADVPPEARPPLISDAADANARAVDELLEPIEPPPGDPERFGDVPWLEYRDLLRQEPRLPIPPPQTVQTRPIAERLRRMLGEMDIEQGVPVPGISARRRAVERLLGEVEGLPEAIPFSGAQRAKARWQEDLRARGTWRRPERPIDPPLLQAERGLLHEMRGGVGEALGPEQLARYDRGRRDIALAEEFGRMQRRAAERQGSHRQFSLTDNLAAISGSGAGTAVGGVLGGAGGAGVGAIAGGLGGALANRLYRGREHAIWATGSELLADVLQNAPEVLGPFAGALQRAQTRGPNAVAATHYVLMSRDPDYRRRLREYQEQQEQSGVSPEEVSP